MPEPTCWELVDLVFPREVCVIFGVTNSTFSNWLNRYPDFPKPIIDRGNGHRLYSLKQIEAWVNTKWPGN